MYMLSKSPWPWPPHVQLSSPSIFRVPKAELTFSQFRPAFQWIPVVFGQGLLWLVSVVLCQFWLAKSPCFFYQRVSVQHYKPSPTVSPQLCRNPSCYIQVQAAWTCLEPQDPPGAGVRAVRWPVLLFCIKGKGCPKECSLGPGRKRDWLSISLIFYLGFSLSWDPNIHPGAWAWVRDE